MFQSTTVEKVEALHCHRGRFALRLLSRACSARLAQQCARQKRQRQRPKPPWTQQGEGRSFSPQLTLRTRLNAASPETLPLRTILRIWLRHACYVTNPSRPCSTESRNTYSMECRSRIKQNGYGGGKPGREVAGKHPLIGRGKQGRMYRLLPR